MGERQWTERVEDRRRARAWAWLAAALCVALPAALLAALFWSSLSAGLAWDDKFLLAHPTYLRMGFSWQTILWPAMSNPAAHWRPLGMLFVAPHLHPGASVEAARWASMGIHAALCAGAGWLCWALSRGSRAGGEARACAAVVCACWLAVSPGASQAAYWLSQRFHDLGAIAVVAGVCAADALRRSGRERSAWIAACVAALCAGLFSELSAAMAVGGAGALAALGWRARPRRVALWAGSTLAAWALLRTLFLGRAFPTGAGEGFYPSAILGDLSRATLAQASPWFDAVPGAGIPFESMGAPGAELAWAVAGLVVWCACAAAGAMRARAGRASGWVLSAWALSTLVAVLFCRALAPEGSTGVVGGEWAGFAAVLASGLAAWALEALGDSRAAEAPGKPGRAPLAMAVGGLAMAAAFGAAALGSIGWAKAWSSDSSLWAAALERHPDSPLAVANSMVALSKGGSMSQALGVGEAYWGRARAKKQLARQESAALATYVSLLVEAGELNHASGVATFALPKSEREPLMALNAAAVLVARERWIEAIDAANFALVRKGKTWNGDRMAGALHEVVARAELGAGRAAVAEAHFIESRRLLGLPTPPVRKDVPTFSAPPLKAASAPKEPASAPSQATR